MFLFRKKQQIVCPRCLSNVTIDKNTSQCPSCRYQFPVRYLQHYEEALPLFVQVFGWSQHGKTMFLDVMRLMLLDIHSLWSQYSYESITELDMLHERILRTERTRGAAPGSTQKKDRDSNDVYIMRLDRMDRWRSRMLVIMDHAGELFESFSVPVEEIPFLIKTPTTFMLVSLHDIEQTAGGESVDQLLNIYLETMLKNKVDFKKERRKLVFVFTKADMIRTLPPNLRSYLMEDEIWNIINSSSGRDGQLSGAGLVAYLERMERVSNAIRDWMNTRAVPGGANLLRLTERYNIDARYTLISATGQDVQEGGGFNIMPRRVLDPLFWALEFQSR